jgi:predicted transcriptional regulator
MARLTEMAMTKEAISIRLKPELLKEVNELAYVHRTSRSKVVERILADFLRRRVLAKHEVIRQKGGRHDSR